MPSTLLKISSTAACKVLRERIEREPMADLMGDAREVLWAVADLLVSVLLHVDAGSDGDEASQDIFYRFLEDRDIIEKRAKASVKEQLERDTKIVYGTTSSEISPRL
ncbi:hypothetical protein NM208_g10424 [Fusarium decemcellulare]|uniref:Uncharacterized protein n=1 Tax=Fusarium decemcellulare TaxID=57161 RepID=A0ACC1RXY5_9HYPO|nr:hypothetical protein NM208_g10424 [Fusarium decemcellulare]